MPVSCNTVNPTILTTSYSNEKEDYTMKKKLYIIPAMLLVAACQPAALDNPSANETKEPADTPQTWSLTIRASREGVATKALDLEEEVRLHTYWKSTEQVQVYKDGILMGYLEVTADEGEKPSTATLSGGNITGPLAENDELTLLIPRSVWDYTEQKGVLTGGTLSVEDLFAYASATVTVETVIGSYATTSPASFTNGQSIYRFGFMAGGSYIDPLGFTVSASAGKLVQSLAWEGGAWQPAYGNLTVSPTAAASDHFYYMALRNDNTETDTYSFVVTSSDYALYLGSKEIPASVLDIPRFISAKNIPLTQPDFSRAFGNTDSSSDVY